MFEPEIIIPVLNFLSTAPLTGIVGFIAWQLSTLCSHVAEWEPTIQVRILEDRDES